MSEKMNNKHTLLIIDDESKLLLGLKATLARAGFNVITAPSGKEGIRLAMEQQPDLVLCDVMMPPPNGFQVKEALGMDPRTDSIPFIFLTARTFSVDRISGLRMGADDYITKPFDIEELVARTKAVLRRNEIALQNGRREMEGTLEEIRKSIASNLAHEFRTPLGIVLATLEVAIKEKESGTLDDLDLYLQQCLGSARKLHTLTQDLILLNQIDQGTINQLRRPVDLKYHFQGPVQQVLNQYPHKNLVPQIFLDKKVKVHAPDAEFAHAVAHLVDNACKFSANGARISIHLFENGYGGCSLVVENEGSTIPIDLREKVFERFYQISQGDNRLYGGLGVGLTVSRAIVEALNGHVEILDSEIGTRVRMVIPPAPADWGQEPDQTYQVEGKGRYENG